MPCIACGSSVHGEFCSHCGMRVPPPPGSASIAAYRSTSRRFPEPRVARHLHSLGVLWCAYAVYRTAEAVLAAVFLFGLSSRWAFSAWGPIRVLPFLPYNPWLRTAAPFVACLTIAGAVAAFAASLALLQRKPWGRALAMVIGILILIRIPIGTALGVYTLWVLAPATSADEYVALTHR